MSSFRYGSDMDAEDNRPLSDRERNLVKRLFSDPFAIPIEFKAWLVTYLEGNPPLLTTASIFGFRSAVAQQIEALETADFLPGMMLDYGGATDPDSHWLICDGRTLDRTTYALLYGVLGFAYSPVPGVDPGGNLFHIPDFRDRIPIGKGSQTESNALGKRAGSRTVALSITHMPAHNHGGGNHSHAYNVQAFLAGTDTAMRRDVVNAGQESGAIANSGSVINTEGSGTAHDNMPPTLTANKIIYVG